LKAPTPLPTLPDARSRVGAHTGISCKTHIEACDSGPVTTGSDCLHHSAPFPGRLAQVAAVHECSQSLERKRKPAQNSGRGEGASRAAQRSIQIASPPHSDGDLDGGLGHVLP
jgi:hypothetical protein